MKWIIILIFFFILFSSGNVNVLWPNCVFSVKIMFIIVRPVTVKLESKRLVVNDCQPLAQILPARNFDCVAFS
jgi:hypothetical protein